MVFKYENEKIGSYGIEQICRVMNIEDIKEFGVYAYNDECGKTLFVEVLEVYTNERKAKVSLYESSGFEIKDIVFTEHLSPILITEHILKALSFEEDEGQLYGLLNEHYFRLKKGNGVIEMIRDKGTMKYVKPSIDRKDFYGCEFIPIPYLHKLQDILGRINLKDFTWRYSILK